MRRPRHPRGCCAIGKKNSFNLEDEGSMFLRNVGVNLHNYILTTAQRVNVRS
jgi:hypothetical protein